MRGRQRCTPTLSIDTGPMPTLDALPAPKRTPLPVRPSRLHRRLALGRPAHRRPVPALRPARARRRRSGVEPQPSRTGIAPPSRGWSHLYLTAADSAALARRAPRWPAAAGLATDDDGFIQGGARCDDSHPRGCRRRRRHYADARRKVRRLCGCAGPAGARRRNCEGRPLRDWAPQRQATSSAPAAGKALATMGALGVERALGVAGRKHRIDRRFAGASARPGQKGRTAMTAQQHRLPPPRPTQPLVAAQIQHSAANAPRWSIQKRRGASLPRRGCRSPSPAGAEGARPASIEHGRRDGAEDDARLVAGSHGLARGRRS